MLPGYRVSTRKSTAMFTPHRNNNTRTCNYTCNLRLGGVGYSKRKRGIFHFHHNEVVGFGQRRWYFSVKKFLTFFLTHFYCLSPQQKTTNMNFWEAAFPVESIRHYQEITLHHSQSQLRFSCCSGVQLFLTHHTGSSFILTLLKYF